jgi:hypothetical protein
MPLNQRSWRPAVVHEVVASFLQSERHQVAQVNHRWVDHPDLGDSIANHNRLRLLYLFRRHLWAEIPPDTDWYAVHSLENDDFDDLHVISRCSWDDSSDRNELRKVADRRPLALNSQPHRWIGSPILWGHAKPGPFTILEGNHRLVALARSGTSGFAIPVFVGISPTPCVWHFEDPPNALANDLWKT